MKTASVRDLRLHFPDVERWLAEGEPVSITKSGKQIAILIKATPTTESSLASVFSERFGKPLPRPKKMTHIAQTLIDDRGL